MWTWYYTLDIEKNIKNINLLIVDRPLGNIQENARYPAIPILYKYFSKNISIIADECNRVDEKNYIAQWFVECPDFTCKYYKYSKPVCIFSKRLGK